MLSLRVQEHREAATSAGLSYVTDGVAGIRRQRAGKGWVFFAPDGTRIRDAAERSRIPSLVIPPAWTDVWICPDRRGHIQVTARDARGRKQYRYHPWYRDARDKSKFRRMLEFSEILPDVRERVERDLRAHDLSRRQILATAARLLDKTRICARLPAATSPQRTSAPGRGPCSPQGTFARSAPRAAGVRRSAAWCAPSTPSPIGWETRARSVANTTSTQGWCAPTSWA